MSQQDEFSNLVSDLYACGVGDSVEAPGTWTDPPIITPTATVEHDVQTALDQSFPNDVDMMDPFHPDLSVTWPPYDASEGALNSIEKSPPEPPLVPMPAPRPAPSFEHIRSPPRRSSTLNPTAAVYTPVGSPQRQSTFQNGLVNGFGAAFLEQMQAFPMPFGGFQPFIARPMWYPTPPQQLQIPRRLPRAPPLPFTAPPPYQPPPRPVFAGSQQAPTLRVPIPPTTTQPDPRYLSPLVTSGPVFAWKSEQPHDSAHPSHRTPSPSSAVSTPIKPGRRSRGHSVVSNITRHSCVSCGKPFPTGADLRHHERNHKTDEEKAFWCESCDVRFIWKKDLVRHEASKRHRKRMAQAQSRMEVFLDCTHERCDRVGEHGFARQDHLERHLATVHRC